MSSDVYDPESDEALLEASWRARPRSFVALMGLYESNHHRLLALTGDLRGTSGVRLASVPGDCDLVLSIVEHSPYTTLFELTYLFGVASAVGESQLVSAPDLQIRIYHDARLAEACAWAPEHGHPLLRTWRENLSGMQLDQRWARNMMLNKWLEYCRDRGYSFRPPRAER